MKKYPGIDYSQRPASYREDENALAAVLRNVKGRERRELIRAHWERGALEELPEALLKESLTDEERDRLGKIHPACMGGEYLPDYEGEETEIARIELRSTTGDVISLRARCRGGLIQYGIVDEYDTEFGLARVRSRKPLTLEELIGLIDGSEHPEIGVGLAMCYNEMNAEDGCREPYRDFTRVSSEFYPQLLGHYRRRFEEWVNEWREAETAKKLEPNREGGEQNEL